MCPTVCCLMSGCVELNTIISTSILIFHNFKKLLFRCWFLCTTWTLQEIWRAEFYFWLHTFIKIAEVNAVIWNIQILCNVCVLQEFRQKVMLGTPFLVIWLVGFIADLNIDSWLIKGLMYGGVWATVQFLSK